MFFCHRMNTGSCCSHKHNRSFLRNLRREYSIGMRFLHLAVVTSFRARMRVFDYNLSVQVSKGSIQRDAKT